MSEKYDGINKFDIQELKDLLTYLIKNRLGNMEAKDMITIRLHFKDLLDQTSFWLEEENEERFAYEMRYFINWLTEFVEDKDREFWGE
tara:strand:+ start:930 stop:1193 length:264 start_codon:yes stop_codon:yes gene_type:complete